MAKKGKKKKKSVEDTDSESTERGLTPMQELFVREYLVDMNASRAAKAAGYAENSAKEQGYQLLHIPSLRTRIQEELKKRFDRIDLSAERVLAELMTIATVDIADAYDEKGNLLPIQEIPEHIRRAISGVEVDEIWDGYGDEREQIGETKKLKLVDKHRALETLARHLKLLTDKVEHDLSDGLAARLAKARKRVSGGSRKN
jgi:phage terminase small subunit